MRATYLALVLMFCGAVLSTTEVGAQNNRRNLFREDTAEAQRSLQRKRSQLLTEDEPASEITDVSAPAITFRRDASILEASGGVILSREGLTAHADTALVDTEAEEGEFYGDVVLSEDMGTFAASSAYLNFTTETALFNDAEFVLETGPIYCNARSLYKYGENKFRLDDFGLTSCGCAEGRTPWSLHGGEGSFTQGGYAHLDDVTFRVYDVPVFYTPYFAFPVKVDRASGILVPRFGLSNQDGFQLRQPIFVVVDDTADLLFTPFIETETRVGTRFQARKLFSKNHSLRNRMIFSDETWRGESLRGLVPGVGVDPVFPEQQRFGLYHSQLWRSESDASIPTSILTDIHWVSDDAMLRELPDEEIGLRTANFLSSTIVAQASLSDAVSAEVSSEYNQSISGDVTENDDVLFQRIPEFALRGLKSFRPFGSNPLGFKMLARGTASATKFRRDAGYEGERILVTPGLEMPLRYKNVVNSSLELTGYSSFYSLGSLADESSLSSDSDRHTFVAKYNLSTAVEKVFEVDREGFLATLTGLGAENQSNRLVRMKHTVEPFARYTFAPDVSQSNLPLFDSLDRIRRRRVVTYGFRTSLLGRFLPAVNPAFPIPELAPSPSTLSQLDYLDAVPDLPFQRDREVLTGGRGRAGEVNRVADLVVKQSYDFIEADEDQDPAREPLSDVGFELTLNPNRSFNMLLDANYSVEQLDLSSWSSTFRLLDDRQDFLQLRYTFVDPVVVNDGVVSPSEQISNIELGMEAVVTGRLKVGFFARYDETASEMIEQAAVVRLLSDCDCWGIDVGVSERTNPNEEQVDVRFTFLGLGDITQDILRRQKNTN